MSENEEFEIDSKSAPSLSLSRQACGYYKKFDVSYAYLWIWHSRQNDGRLKLISDKKYWPMALQRWNSAAAKLAPILNIS